MKFLKNIGPGTFTLQPLQYLNHFFLEHFFPPIFKPLLIFFVGLKYSIGPNKRKKLLRYLWV